MPLSVGFFDGVLRYIKTPCNVGLACFLAKQDSSLTTESCWDKLADTYARDYPKKIFQCVEQGEKAVVFIADLAVFFKHLPREM